MQIIQSCSLALFSSEALFVETVDDKEDDDDSDGDKNDFICLMTSTSMSLKTLTDNNGVK